MDRCEFEDYMEDVEREADSDPAVHPDQMSFMEIDRLTPTVW